MIHFRTTVQIAPGRQADMVGRMHEFGLIWKAHGVTMRSSLVATGNLGRFCVSTDIDTMAQWEAIKAKVEADPLWIALSAKGTAEIVRGELFFVPGSIQEEFWRDA